MANYPKFEENFALFTIFQFFYLRTIFRNLMYLQNHPEEASSLNIDFTAMLGELGGQVELKPGGSEIQVNYRGCRL